MRVVRVARATVGEMDSESRARAEPRSFYEGKWMPCRERRHPKKDDMSRDRACAIALGGEDGRV
jgi:hypothetical protein